MKKVKQLIPILQEIFGLTQWELTLERVNKSGGADVMVEHRYRRYRIRLYNDFFTEPLSWQADALIHEFCHHFNAPIYNLIEEMWAGKMITREHADDIMEQCNTRAEKVVVRLLSDNSLAKARKEYITVKKPDKVKRGSKLTKKRPKKKTGTI
jgi:hypothetical protein